jgi:hypothetical protein
MQGARPVRSVARCIRKELRMHDIAERDPSPVQWRRGHAAAAVPSAISVSAAPLVGIVSPTLAAGVGRDFATEKVATHQIIPFPDGWGENDLLMAMAGPIASMIAAKLNDGWKLTFYRYRTETGAVIFVVLRLDPPAKTEKKFVRPLRVRRMIGMRADVVFGSLPPPRPLYGLDRLAANSQAPVLFVEGEKAADAGQAHFPDHVVVTWAGGADGIATTDLRPIAGRDAIVWPDHDTAGERAARILGEALIRAGAASVRIVRVPAAFPPKWDVADPIPSDADA